jgi:uncharacterized protein
MTEQGNTISVEVMYATLAQVWSVRVQLPLENANVAAALALARLSPQWPSIEIDPQHLAVFGQSVQLDSTLHEGDRVEILRPLLIDPMDARRSRAEKKLKG